MDKQLRKKQQDRYRKLLTPTRQWMTEDIYFEDINKTMALLKEIYSLSETEQGREKIYQIQPFIIGYYLIEAVKTKWRRAYGMVDNYCLRIITNLAKSPLFYHDAIHYKENLVSLIKTVYSKNFEKCASEAIAQINKAIQSLRQKQIQKMKQQKEQKIIKEPQLDFLNFSLSWKFYHFYDDYIQNLIGLLDQNKRQVVIHQFPKSCFGCLVFSMVISSNRANKKQTGMKFLKKITNNWFTSKLYDILLGQIRSLYKYKLKYNHDLTDPGQTTCNRFWISNTRYDDIFYFLSKINQYSSNQYYRQRQIRRHEDFQQYLEEFKQRRLKKQINDDFIQRMRSFCKQLQKTQSSDKMFGVSQIITGGIKQQLDQIFPSLVQFQKKNFKSCVIKYILSNELKPNIELGRQCLFPRDFRKYYDYGEQEDEEKQIQNDLSQLRRWYLSPNIDRFISTHYIFVAKVQDDIIIGFRGYQGAFRIYNTARKKLVEVKNIYVSRFENISNQYYGKNVGISKEKEVIKNPRISFMTEGNDYSIQFERKQGSQEWPKLTQHFKGNTKNENLIQFTCTAFQMYQVEFTSVK